MIVGYNTRGEVVFTFKDEAEMSVALNLGLSNIQDSFNKNRQFNLDDVIFHKEDPQFSLDFGYPEPLGATNQEIKEYFEARNSKIVEAVEAKNHMDAGDGGKYDEKGNSSHYQAQFMEFIRLQEAAYGTVVAYLICISQVDKYCQRAGVKEGVPAAKDLTKRDWYKKASVHFKKKIDAVKEGNLHLENRNKFVPLREEVIDLLAVEFPMLKEVSKEYIPLSKAIEDEN